jgi:hypothetical protein
VRVTAGLAERYVACRRAVTHVNCGGHTFLSRSALRCQCAGDHRAPGARGAKAATIEVAGHSSPTPLAQWSASCLRLSGAREQADSPDGLPDFASRTKISVGFTTGC